MSFKVVSKIGWFVVGNELIGSINSCVSSRVMCPLISSGAGESVSSLGLDFAQTWLDCLRGVLKCWVSSSERTACKLGLCEALEEPLDAAGEQPPAPSWPFSRSACGKECGSFGMSPSSIGSWPLSLGIFQGDFGGSSGSQAHLNCFSPSLVQSSCTRQPFQSTVATPPPSSFFSSLSENCSKLPASRSSVMLS